MGTAIKDLVPDRVKPSFVIFDIRTLWRLLGITWKDKVRNEDIRNQTKTTKNGPHHQGKKIEMAGTCVAHGRRQDTKASHAMAN